MFEMKIDDFLADRAGKGSYDHVSKAIKNVAK